MHSKPGECTPAPQVFPKGICEPAKETAHISAAMPPPASGRFARKVITASEKSLDTSRAQCNMQTA